MSALVIRPGRSGDVVELTELYNYYIRETPITFDIQPFTVEQRKEWFAKFGSTGRYRILVAEDGGEVVGFASSSPFRPKAAYDTSVEVSIYLRHDRKGRGIGAKLYEALFEAIRGEDIHVALAGITLPNEASLAIHKRFGFVDVGVYHEVGRKFGRFWDVVWMEKIFA
jgi:phosphinothricin acetyltransferase